MEEHPIPRLGFVYWCRDILGTKKDPPKHTSGMTLTALNCVDFLVDIGVRQAYAHETDHGEDANSPSSYSMAFAIRARCVEDKLRTVGLIPRYLPSHLCVAD